MISPVTWALPLALGLLLSVSGCCVLQQGRAPAVILAQDQPVETSRYATRVPEGWAVSESFEFKAGAVQLLAPGGQRADGTSTSVLVLYALDGATTLPEARKLLEKFGRAQMKGQPVTGIQEDTIGGRDALVGTGYDAGESEGPPGYVFWAMLDGDHHLLAVYMGDGDAVAAGLEEAAKVVAGVRFKASGALEHAPAAGVDAVDLNAQLASHLSGLLDTLVLLSLQPGNDEDENKAVSESIDATHEAVLQLYEELNRSEYRQEALTPLVLRYMELCQRTDVLITAHGPIRTTLPAPFAAMSRQLKQVIERARREYVDSDAASPRAKAVHELFGDAAELDDDLTWSGLRKRYADVAELQARFKAVMKRSQELFPGDRRE